MTATSVDGIAPRRLSLMLVALATAVAGTLSLAAPAQAAAPTAPTSVSARAGVNQAKVYWQPPADDGGATVSSYTATSSPDGRSCTASAAARSCYVTGLTNGQAYTFTVRATNSDGSSPESAPTAPVTPDADTSPPVLESAIVTPNRVSSLGGTVTVELRITDDRSGRADPSGALDANPAVALKQRNGSNSIGFTRNVTRVSGDEYDGIYRATITIPSGTPAGWWDLQIYPIRDRADNSTFFITRPGVLVGAPGAPTDVSATAAADRTVTVTWTAPADNGGNAITGYRVTDSAGGVRTVSGTTWSGAFPDIDENTPLTFTVAAINAAGPSEESAPSAAVTVPAVAPSAPRDVMAEPGDGRATVSWTAPASTGGAAITGYTVSSAPGGATVEVAGDVHQANVSGLDNGTTYTFTVVATNHVGQSPAASSAPVTPAGVPGTVTGVDATAGDGSAIVDWEPADGNGAPVTGYTLTLQPGDRTVQVDGGTTQARVDGLVNGTTYTVEVTATNAVGTSVASSSATFTPVGAPGRVAKPTALVKGRKVVLRWKPAESNGSAITRYRVTGAKPFARVVGSKTKLVYKGVKPGTYRVRVAARNDVGWGAPSKTLKVRVKR